jgi:hypothetical protein
MKISFFILIFIATINAVMLRDAGTLDEEVVFDTTTSLIWQDDNDARERTKTWLDAISYCDSLSKLGYTDWRLPNINELYTLVDITTSSPALDSTFEQSSNAKYWSSTTYSYEKTKAWHIDFNTGREDFSLKTSTLNIRCVRSSN